MTRKFQESSTKWWTKTARLHRPKEAEEIQKRMREKREYIFSALGEHKDASKLIATLVELISDTLAFSHYAGIRRGFTIALELEKFAEKKTERYKAEIIRIILQHPDWTTRRILEELDEREVQFIRLGRLPKTEIRRWSDVAHVSSYKTLVSRIKLYAKQLTQVKGWNKVMSEHRRLRREE